VHETLIIPQDASALVTLARLKQQARVDADMLDEDELLTSYLVTAVGMAQHLLGRPILPQTVEREFEEAASHLSLRHDVIGVVSVTAVTLSGDLDIQPSGWRLRGRRQLLLVDGWPAGALAVRVRFTCGAWPTPAAVPEPVKDWVLMYAATLYVNRERFVIGSLAHELPRNMVDGLLDEWRAY